MKRAPKGSGGVEVEIGKLKIERLKIESSKLMLIGGFFSCNENEDIEVEKKPDTIQTEYGEVIISADYVPIDWNKSANQVLSIEVPNEKEAVVTMALEDKKLAAEIQAGSLITVDVDTAIYLRKVTSATVDGTKVTCVTTQGTLEDVFGESEFELCMGEEPDCDLYVCEIDEECIFPDSIEEDDEEEDVFYSNSDDEENEDRKKSCLVFILRRLVDTMKMEFGNVCRWLRREMKKKQGQVLSFPILNLIFILKMMELDLAEELKGVSDSKLN